MIGLEKQDDIVTGTIDSFNRIYRSDFSAGWAQGISAGITVLFLAYLASTIVELDKTRPQKRRKPWGG